MHAIVCIKQVPDTSEVKIDPERGTLIREGVPSIINPFDTYAIEEAIRLKEKFGGKVTVICMGPPQAKEALKEALAMGCDEAILLSDRAFAGSDTWATAYTLAQAIRRIGDFDVILCGKQAIDGDTGQVHGAQASVCTGDRYWDITGRLAEESGSIGVRGHYVMAGDDGVRLLHFAEISAGRAACRQNTDGVYHRQVRLHHVTL